MSNIEKRTDALIEWAKEQLKGEEENLRQFAAEVASDFTMIATEQDPDVRARLTQEVADRMLVLKEKYRIRAVRKGWQTFERALVLAMKMI